MRGRTWKLVIYIFLVGFILNLAGIVSHVVVSAFAKRWFGKPLPPAFTTDWFTYAWTNFELGQVLFITLFIALAVVFIALAIGSLPPTFWRGVTSAPNQFCCCCISCHCSFHK